MTYDQAEGARDTRAGRLWCRARGHRGPDDVVGSYLDADGPWRCHLCRQPLPPRPADGRGYPRVRLIVWGTYAAIAANNAFWYSQGPHHSPPAWFWMLAAAAAATLAAHAWNDLHRRR